MHTSELIGGVPFLWRLFDLNPLVVGIIVFVVDFGAMWFVEGIGPWNRKLYISFLYNDTVFLPLYFIVATAVLRNFHGSAWYTSRWWHITVLVAGFLIGIGMEAVLVKIGQHTMAQEVSPSLLYHTFIFGIVFYWGVGSIIPVVMTRKPLWASMLVVVAFIGFTGSLWAEAVSPKPKDAHIEWSWRTLRGKRRAY